MNNNWKKKKPLIGLLIVSGIAILFGVVMLLWNAILPEVLGVKEISYWQSAGITVLSKILFGGFKGGKRGKHPIRAKFREKFMHMTDEEKSAFQAEWKSRCRK